MEEVIVNPEISENLIVLAYYIYLPIVIILTAYVARRLFKSGKVFMNDIFKGRVEIASATNKLFELGFYLLNLGFALLIMEINEYIFDFDKQKMVEVLSYKIGGFSIYLGFMLFLNLYLFFRGRKRSGGRKPRAFEGPSTLKPGTA